MLNPALKEKLDTLSDRMKERGVVDVKFAKAIDYASQTADKQASDIIEVIECMLDGRFEPAPKFNDSVRVVGDTVRGLPAGELPADNTLCPIARCGGGRSGDLNENTEKGGTASSQ